MQFFNRKKVCVIVLKTVSRGKWNMASGHHPIKSAHEVLWQKVRLL